MATILVACSSDPVNHGMTAKQKETYSQAIAGTYTGTYVTIYNVGDNDSESVKVKEEGAEITVTDQTMHSVVLHDYPVNLISRVVDNPELAEALSGMPDMDIVVNYHFYNMQDNGDVSWGFKPTAMPITLEYGGAAHHLILKLWSKVYLQLTKANLDAHAPFADGCVFQFDIEGIYEGNTLVEDLDFVWRNNGKDFLTYFQFDRH